jgi:excisionase family DNA binding protein
MTNVTRPEVERLLFTVEEVGQVLGLGRTKVYDLIRRGELASVRIGQCRRVTHAALISFVADLPRTSGDLDLVVHRVAS